MYPVFEEKLKALQCPFASDFVINVQNTLFRKIVVWLASEKINSDVQLPETLKDVSSPKWKDGFAAYKKSMDCPLSSKSNLYEDFYWLLSLAIKNRFVNIAENSNVTPTPDSIDVESDEFRKQIELLANKFNICCHSDHLQTLEACLQFLKKYLSAEAIRSNRRITMDQPSQNHYLALADIKNVFDLGNEHLNTLSKCLSLIYIQDLRELQTNINDVIVTVQQITADPKTDSKLGKVGF